LPPETDSDLVRFDVDGRKAVITLNRPEALNALNRPLREALGRAIHRLDHDDGLWVGILAGEGGRAFSTGADLKEMADDDRSEGPQTLLNRGADGSGVLQIKDCRKPIIAAIDGYCIAGGFELTVHCDILVATRQSRFGLPEPRRSLLAGPGLHYLSRLIPYHEAMLLQLTGGLVTSERAYEVGLIQRLVEDRDEMWRAAHAIADEILLCAPLAVQAIKRIVRDGRPLPPEYSERLAEPFWRIINETDDRLEGPRAFAEKRAPEWRGR
jgi:enoyl-CoA hydratase/carnithine racemase